MKTGERLDPITSRCRIVDTVNDGCHRARSTPRRHCGSERCSTTRGNAGHQAFKQVSQVAANHLQRLPKQSEPTGSGRVSRPAIPGNVLVPGLGHLFRWTSRTGEAAGAPIPPGRLAVYRHPSLSESFTSVSHEASWRRRRVSAPPPAAGVQAGTHNGMKLGIRLDDASSDGDAANAQALLGPGRVLMGSDNASGGQTRILRRF